MGQATQTQPVFLSADGFAAALGAIPPDDSAGLERVVRFISSCWDDACSGTAAEKLHLVPRQLTGL
jgi:hypothetical protein